MMSVGRAREAYDFECHIVYDAVYILTLFDIQNIIMSLVKLNTQYCVTMVKIHILHHMLYVE